MDSDKDNSKSDLGGESLSAEESRRRFIRKVGTSIFAVTLVDVVDSSSRNQVLAQSGGGCEAGVVEDANCSSTDTDESCSSSSNDESCGSKAGDYDQSCSAANIDESCGSDIVGGKGATDPDQSCSTTSTDDNCKNVNLGTGPGLNADESCSITSPDGGCGISNVAPSGNDEDESCTANGSTADQGCGDCDDHHDSDEHCGEPTPTGGIDPDELCGHQHVYGLTEDENCSTISPDAGCGNHKTTYGGIDLDDDEYCTGTNPDMDCTAAAAKGGADANCDANPASNPNTTSPDEACSSTDPDGACGHYDADESCGNGESDEACGVVWYWGDTDSNCTDQSSTGTGATDNTGNPHEIPPS